jgi:hypothetical protein
MTTMTIFSDNSPQDVFKTSFWYNSLSNYTFPTTFLKLSDEEKKLLSDGVSEGDKVAAVISRLNGAMKAFFGSKFVFLDRVAPTDTERFKLKNGAVYSAASAWKYLALSDKARNSIERGESDHICIRPYRRISRPREFRLFIKDKKLRGMSQLWLIRHFKRLEGRKEEYWARANSFFGELSWLLPCVSAAMDVYFTSSGRILIIDINPLGEPTSPLLFKSWEYDWEHGGGIKIIPPPIKINGDVQVSF